MGYKTIQYFSRWLVFSWHLLVATIFLLATCLLLLGAARRNPRWIVPAEFLYPVYPAHILFRSVEQTRILREK